MTSAGNGGARRIEPDGEIVTENEIDNETPSNKRRNWNGQAQFALLKRRVTGELAEMEEEDINRECMNLPASHSG